MSKINQRNFGARLKRTQRCLGFGVRELSKATKPKITETRIYNIANCRSPLNEETANVFENAFRELAEKRLRAAQNFLMRGDCAADAPEAVKA